MGNDPTKSQEMLRFCQQRQYSPLPVDQCFPSIIFVQRKKELSILALVEADASTHRHRQAARPNMISLVQCLDTGNCHYGVYEWSQASLAEYEEYLRGTQARQIKPQQFMHIVKAVTLAYATLAHLPHQEPCLRTSLKHIRLFPAKDVAETNITLGAYRPGNRLGLKLIPWSLAAHSAERYGSFRESVKCIHGGGTYSDLQVLGHQLLGLSCSLQMKEFRERENALKDLYQGFGEHVHELISLMLQDSSWQTLFSKIKEAELGSSHTYNTDCSKSYIEIHKSQIPQQIILHQPIMSPLTPTKAGNQSPQLKNCRVLQGNPQTGLGSLKNRASQQLDSQLVDTFRNGAKMIFTPSLKSQQNTHLVGVPKIHYDPKTKIDFDRKGIEKSRQCPTEQLSLQNQSLFSRKDTERSSLLIEVTTANLNNQSPLSPSNKLEKQNSQGSLKPDNQLTESMFSLNLTPIKRSSAREKTSSDQQQSCSELKSFSFSEDSSRVGEEPASYRGAVNAQGEMEGQGKIEFAEGGSYVGEFYRNKLHGYGKLFFPSGRLAYEGYFHQNKFHRYGKIFVERPVHVSAINFLDFCPAEQTRVFDVETHRGKVEETIWKYYEGEIQLGKRHGKGVLMFENGERFEGQFQDGEVHGSGIFYGKSGTVHGSWCHNKMTQ